MLRESALLAEILADLLDLPVQQRTRTVDCHENRVRRDDRIVIFQSRRKTLAHRKDVLPVFMAQIIFRREVLEGERFRLEVFRIAFAPRRFACIDDECLVVAGEFLQGGFRHVKELQFGFFRGSGAGRALDDILPRRTRCADHLPHGLAEGVVLVVVVPAAERCRGVIHKAR